MLGFIGLCGVIQKDAGGTEPHWLKVLAALLVLAAFALACAATALVALAAWPVYGPHPRTEVSNEEIANTSRRLRVGITLTYVAVAVLALGTSSAWWPGGSSGSQAQGSVEEMTRPARSAASSCRPSGPGVLVVSAGDRVVELALDDVVAVYGRSPPADRPVRLR